MNEIALKKDQFSLVKYDAMCVAIVACHDVQEAKEIRDKAIALEAYFRQASNTEPERLAAVVRVRAERQAGQLLKEMDRARLGAQPGNTLANKKNESPASGPSFLPPKEEAPPPTPTLKDLGISKNQSSQWQRLAEVPDDIFETRMEKKPAKAHVSANTGNSEWYTPSTIIEMARTVMGSIDTDPASSDIAQQCVKAGQFYTKSDNGLEQTWTGNVWLNPPYAQPAIVEFSSKLIEKWKGREFSQAIVLVNNGTESRWLQQMLLLADAVCFPEGRIKFLDADGAPGAPLQGQVLLYFGEARKRFHEIFGQSGAILFNGA